MAETAAAVEQEFKLLALDLVVESKTNPRKTFDPKQLEDLTASVKEKGVIVPILVRPIGAKFEVVAGARRYRAAKKADLSEIPAIIRELSDDQALEAQVIENLQRADVHPLEEAEGYQALLKRKRHTVESLAEQVGKSVSYIWQRLKLTELIPTAQQAFLSDQITAGHAVMIARLQPNDQKDALQACIGREWIGGQHQQTLVSVRGLARWIQDNVHLSLDGAPWRKDDAELVKDAGPCTTCPKRSGNAPALWPEISRAQTCTDRACYQTKLNAHSIAQKKELEAKGERVERISEDYQPSAKGVIGTHDYRIAAKNKKRCAETIKGIFVDGDKRGQVVDICVGDSCRIHREIQAHNSSGRSNAQQAKFQKERAKEILKERATGMARLQILDEILKGAKGFDKADLDVVAAAMARRIYMRYEISELEIMPKHLTDADPQNFPEFSKATETYLARFIIAAALDEDVRFDRDGDLLYAMAKRHKIDFKAIEKRCLQAVVYDRTHKDRMQRWKGLKASGNTRFETMTCQLCGREEKEQSKGGWHWIRKNDKNKTALCNDCERLEKK